MSIQNILFDGEMRKRIPKVSSNMHLTCFFEEMQIPYTVSDYDILSITLMYKLCLLCKYFIDVLAKSANFDHILIHSVF